jgi:hypothetical protein
MGVKLIPKLWIFRSISENSGYWIDSSSKEISKVYPHLKELRKKIDEIKVINNALETYVIS